MTEPDTALDAARRYLANGWSPIPLPAGQKWPPPNGVTGWRGRYTTGHDLTRKGWDWTGNIGLRLPPDVIGIDVDAYAGGLESLTVLEEAHGPLPPTVISTARDDGSGIGLYRVPVGTTLATDPAEGIDIIQAHHRYTVCAPSINPKTGTPYRWQDEQDEETIGSPPHPGDLPELPWAWVQALAVDKMAGTNAATPDAANAFLEAHTATTRPAALKGVTASLVDIRKGGRHDAIVTALCWAMREAAAGLYPAADAVEAVHAWWINAMSDDPHRRESGEFGGAVLWAIGQAENAPERVAVIAAEPRSTRTSTPTTDPETGEINDPRNLPDQFWTARPVLEHIRAAAHCRARSADAVLLFVLARIAVTIPPRYKLPAITGGPGSLNFLGAVIGSSGSGKSTAGAVARELVPIDRTDVVADLPLGSGEGIAEAYFEQVKEEGPDGKMRSVKCQTRTGLYFTLDEGQALAEMGNRKGATLLPTLRTAWSGDTLGQANATNETHRIVKAHSYRLSCIIGFQAEHATGLLDDTAGGTPQRFVFGCAVDPNVPDDAPEWPGELSVWLPALSPDSGIIVAPEVAAGVRQRSLMATRGEIVLDPLDSHADLVRLKVAALLAWLDHRAEVNPEDWELAGMVMRTSRAVRQWVIGLARATAAEAALAGHRRAADREVVVADTVEQRALTGAARAIARKVHQGGGVPVGRRVLGHAIAGKHRKLVTVDDVIEEAERLLWIEPNGALGWVPGKGAPT